jgi:hypothetical protein
VNIAKALQFGSIIDVHLADIVRALEVLQGSDASVTMVDGFQLGPLPTACRVRERQHE